MEPNIKALILDMDGVLWRGPKWIIDPEATFERIREAGLGVALLPEFLIERELASGELVVACENRIESEGGYFLVWPPERENHPPLRAFREWLTKSCALGGAS